jgi:hypothetical protein
MLTRALIALLTLTSATVAAAYDPIVLKRGWYRVDRTIDGVCLGEVGTNGQFYVLTVAGLDPDEEARLVITNGDMKPIDRVVRADGAGRWQEYYIPFRFNGGDGAVVSASITSASCALPLQFAWQRKRA